MIKRHNSLFVLFQEEKGLTMIELLTVIGLILVLAATAIPVYNSMRISSEINERTSLLIQTLRTAKEKSVARVENAGHGIKLETDSYTIYYGSSYVDRMRDYDHTVTLKEIGLSWELSGTGHPDEINFSKGIGVPSRIGTITLTNVAEKTKTITINEIGKIEQ